MAIVAIVAFVCGALFGGAASVLGILAYGMLHAPRSSRRTEVGCSSAASAFGGWLRSR
jgi:hypothetical protein